MHRMEELDVAFRRQIADFEQRFAHGLTDKQGLLEAQLCRVGYRLEEI